MRSSPLGKPKEGSQGAPSTCSPLDRCSGRDSCSVRVCRSALNILTFGFDFHLETVRFEECIPLVSVKVYWVPISATRTGGRGSRRLTCTPSVERIPL